DGVDALPLRRHVYLDADAAVPSVDLPVGEAVLATTEGRRRRVSLDDAYLGQALAGCRPHVLLFPRIVPSAYSTVLPLDRLRALRHLLASSGPHLFDRRTMASHLDVLKRLVQQTEAYALQAGRDLYRDPLTLVPLLSAVQGAERWPG